MCTICVCINVYIHILMAISPFCNSDKLLAHCITEPVLLDFLSRLLRRAQEEMQPTSWTSTGLYVCVLNCTFVIYSLHAASTMLLMLKKTPINITTSLSLMMKIVHFLHTNQPRGNQIQLRSSLRNQRRRKLNGHLQSDDWGKRVLCHMYLLTQRMERMQLI